MVGNPDPPISLDVFPFRCSSDFYRHLDTCPVTTAQQDGYGRRETQARLVTGVFPIQTATLKYSFPASCLDL